jgi:hypothetical protein
MEHFQDLVVDINIIHRRKNKYLIRHFMNNIFELLDFCPNLIFKKHQNPLTCFKY